jgi:hypothetical protein
MRKLLPDAKQNSARRLQGCKVSTLQSLSLRLGGEEILLLFEALKL